MRAGLLRGINPPFGGLSPCPGQVAYALRTRAPVAGGHIAAAPLPLDLHVLGLSLAFILSQDQTLRCMTFFCFCIFRAPCRRLAPRGRVAGPMLLVRLVSQYVNVRVAVFFSGRPRGPPDGSQSWGFSPEPANLFLSPASVEAPSFRLAGAKVAGCFYFARGWRGIFCGGGRRGVWFRGLEGGLICVKMSGGVGRGGWGCGVLEG